MPWDAIPWEPAIHLGLFVHRVEGIEPGLYAMARDPGKVDDGYLRTSTILPTDPFAKAEPGGCAGTGPANGNLTRYPPSCSWNRYAA